uniref:3-phosphoinositide-dependent protein kinase 1 n=1 Tax=Globodera pallida TaxID=36090 RepID=A0A183C2D9_GLOPA
MDEFCDQNHCLGRNDAEENANVTHRSPGRKGSRLLDESELRAAIKHILAVGDAGSSGGEEAKRTTYQQQQQEEGETDSTSSSMSSHTGTMKSSSNGSDWPYCSDRMKMIHKPAKLNLNEAGPAPPSPGSVRTPLEGVSTEETLQRLRGVPRDEQIMRTIATRTPMDFFFVKVLGEGSFSTVYFAKEVTTGDEYAIKVLLKSEIRREAKVRYVLREKDIMAALTYAHGGHPFVIRLYCTFQDNDRLYFALAYAKHGELLDLLRRLGSFDEAATLFYASEILCALEFLHQCKVIHRDLKPENILVGADWHIMISDFGTAKIVDEQQPTAADSSSSFDAAAVIDPLPPGEVPGIVPSLVIKQTKRSVRSSFVGTAHYISPEVLKSEDVGPECDYWALGAIIFQMISGQPPFRAMNEYKILKKILNLDFHFPDGFPEVARDLVSRLLVYKPTERLGSLQTGGIDELKRHTFFKDVEWPSLFTRKPPELKPYLPASSGEPAFYGEYCPLPSDGPMDFEPGLNEAALYRLMGLGSSGGGVSGEFAEIEFNRMVDGEDRLPNDASSSPSRNSMPSAEELERRRLNRLERQRKENKYHRFVEDNLILKSGLIDKKKGLFARRRMFLLTEGPRLYYVDPVTMHLKGEVPFSEHIRTEAKNFRTFFVHTPKRTYYLFDPERHAKNWCDAIDWAREKYLHREHLQQSKRPKTPTTTETAKKITPKGINATVAPRGDSSSRPNSLSEELSAGARTGMAKTVGKGLIRGE